MKTKTRFQKLTAWLLTLAMLMTFIPSFTLGVSADTITSGTSGTISYTIDSDGVLTFTGSGAIQQYFSDSIDANHRNLVKRIVIENGITSIGMQALDFFYKVTSVSIAQTVTSISKNAFLNDRNIKTITYWGTSEFTATNILNSSVTPAIYVKTNYSNTKMFGKSVTKILTDTSKECAVKFDMNGYGTQVDSQYVLNIEGYNKVTKPTDPSAPEVKFEGWYKDSTLTTAWNFDTDTVSDNITLYAKWNTTPDHTVSFVMGSYGTAISDRGVVSGSLIAEPETPTDENGVFLGWYKDSAFNTAWDFAVDTVTANTTLYAKWRAIEGTRPQNGDGSEESPYEIGTADELYWFADYYNNSGLISEAHAILVADITVNQNVLNADGTLNGDGSNFRAWTPIGKYPNGYKGYIGTFDGQGYAISGLYFNNEDTTAGNSVGLFGYVGRSGATGTIRNVEVLDSYFKGYQNVGGIVGQCYNYNFSIENCKSAATVYAKRIYAGGIVGYPGSIKNCLAIGNVSGLRYVGAITGLSSTTSHTNCYYLTGCAVNDSKVVQTGAGIYSTTSASNTGENTNYYGVTKEQLASGEVAYKLQGAQEDGTVVVWGQQLTGENAEAYPTLGGPRVVLDTATGTYINSEEGSSHTRVRGYCCDSDYDEPVLVDSSNYTSLGLTSDYIGYYAISNYGQLYGFAKIVNGGDYDANAVLTDNILANENVLKDDGTLGGDEATLWQWNPILPDGSVESTGTLQKYEGTFDGNNKYISGLYYNNSVGAVRGLFGYVGETGTIKDLGIVDSYFYGQRTVGSIVGSNSGTITNCYNEGTVKAYPKATTGVMNKSAFLGGIAGYNAGKIEDCYNKGYISGGKDAESAGGIAGASSGLINKCYNEGKVEADTTVGGIVGSLYKSTVSNSYNKGTVSSLSTSSGSMASTGGIAGLANISDGELLLIEKCWNSGTVSAAGKGRYAGGVVGYQSGQYLTVKNCYNTGKVDAGNLEYVGGIIGYGMMDAVIETSYNYAEVTGSTYVGGVVGGIGTVSGTVTDNDITITNCYYLEGCAVDSNDTAQNGVGNETAGSTTEDVAGETTALTLEQMTDDADWKTNYAGFDATNVWSKNANTASAWYLPKLDSNSPTVAIYAVTIEETENGTVTASPTAAAEGDTVTLTVTPATDYELDTLSVKDADDNDVTVSADNTFTMPASNVTVTATFKAIDYLKITNMSLLLDGRVGMKVYIEYNLIDTDTLTFSGTMNNSNDSSSAEKNYTVTLDPDGKTAYAVVHFAPKDVDNMSLDAVISADTLSGTEVTLDNIPTLSVPAYIETFRALDEEDEGRIAYEGLINALEKYCACADVYFDTSKTALEDIVLTDAEIEEISLAGESASVTLESSDSLELCGSSLLIKETVTLRHYFKLKGEAVPTGFTVVGGTALAYLNDGESYVYTDVAEIPAYELSDVTEVNVSGEGADITVSCAPLMYVDIIRNDSNTRLANVVKALYRYYVEAKELQ